MAIETTVGYRRLQEATRGYVNTSKLQTRSIFPDVVVVKVVSHISLRRVDLSGRDYRIWKPSSFPAFFGAQTKSHSGCDLPATSHIGLCDPDCRTSLRVSRSRALVVVAEFGCGGGCMRKPF